MHTQPGPPAQFKIPPCCLPSESWVVTFHSPTLKRAQGTSKFIAPWTLWLAESRWLTSWKLDPTLQPCPRASNTLPHIAAAKHITSPCRDWTVTITKWEWKLAPSKSEFKEDTLAGERSWRTQTGDTSRQLFKDMQTCFACRNPTFTALPLLRRCSFSGCIHTSIASPQTPFTACNKNQVPLHKQNLQISFMTL